MIIRGAGAALGIVLLLAAAAAAQPATIDWSRQFGTTTEDFGEGIARDASGNLIVGGYTTPAPGSSSPGNAFVVKYDSAGTLSWNNPIAATYVTSVATDSGGNVFATGGTYSGGPTLPDVFVQKLGPAGNVLWTQTFGTISSDQPNGLVTDSAGNVYVSGRLESGLSNQDAFLAKYNASGTQQWLRRFGTAGSDYVASVKLDPTGNPVVVGGCGNGLAPGGGGGADPFARKYDANGNVLWTRQWGTNQSDHSDALAIDNAANIFITGQTEADIDGSGNPNFERRGFVSRLAPDGTIAWTKMYDFGDDAGLTGIELDAAGDPFLAGWALHGLTNDDFLLAQLNPSNGGIVWSQQLAGVAATDEFFSGLAVDATGTKLWAAGYTTGSFNGAPNANTNATEDAVLAQFSVPEPSTATALLATALIVLRRRRTATAL
jgi:Beta-propeller repeat